MKILFINGGLGLGGIASSLLALLQSLQNVGIDVNLYLVDPPKDADARIPPFVKLVQISELDKIARIPLGFIPKLRFFISRRLLVNSAILHFFRRFPSKDKQIQRKREMHRYQLRDERISRCSGVKLDLSQRYDAVISWGELLTDYVLSNNIICRAKYGWIHPDYKDAGFDSRIDKRNLANLDGIVAISEAGKKSLEEAFPEWKNKIFSVNNLLSVDDIRQKAEVVQAEIGPDRMKLLTVARVQNASKAIDRAIRIAKKLRGQTKPFFWYMIGDGEDLAEMKSYAKEMGVDDIVIFLGAKENPYPYFEAADLFVLQSYYEGRPIVIDESLLLGTPVLVTDFPAARQQVRDNVDGMIVPNDEDEICSKLAYVMNNEALLKEWKSNLLERDEKEYTDIEPFLHLIGGEK